MHCVCLGPVAALRVWAYAVHMCKPTCVCACMYTCGHPCPMLRTEVFRRPATSAARLSKRLCPGAALLHRERQSLITESGSPGGVKWEGSNYNHGTPIGHPGEFCSQGSRQAGHGVQVEPVHSHIPPHSSGSLPAV